MLRRHAEIIWSSAVCAVLVALAIVLHATDPDSGGLLEAVAIAVGREIALPLIPVSGGALFAAILIRGWFGAGGGPGEAIHGTCRFASARPCAARPDTVVLAAAIIYAATVLAVGGVL